MNSSGGGINFEERSYYNEEMEQQRNSAMAAAGGQVDLQLIPMSPEEAHANMMQFGGPASHSGSWAEGNDSSGSNYKEELMGNAEMLHGLVTGHDMDSKKTERLSQLLPTQDPRLENCFVGEGQWDPAKQRFMGAPDWRVVASALERTLHDLQCEHIAIELDLDEKLIDALSTDPSGFISFDQFSALLAEADSSG